jgi:RNA 3'-terminal phosphate cyclase (ATP)
VPVGKYLADQLLLPLGIAAWRYGVKSQFLTLPLTPHSTTHVDVLRTFLDVPIEVTQDGAAVRISIG